VIIIAGSLTVDPADRDRYLELFADVVPMARNAPGCLDFVQAPDPVDPARINVYERWDSDEHLLAFRESGGPPPPDDAPEIRSATVQKYRIAAVESP
jgi:quinol monooxygenase YgiN